MTLIRIFPALFLALAATHASADVYKCINDNGRITYTNETAGNSNCTRLSDDLPVSSIPVPNSIKQRTGSSSSSTPSASSGGSSGGNFPRIAPGAQRERDDTRRQVLEKELAGEQTSLVKAKSELAEQEAVRYGNERNYQKVLDRLKPFQDTVEVHQRNIEALEREIGNLK